MFLPEFWFTAESPRNNLLGSMPKAAAPPTEKSLQMSGLLAKIKDPSVGDLRESVIDAASNKEGAIDRADFERLAAAIKEEAVSDYVGHT